MTPDLLCHPHAAALLDRLQPFVDANALTPLDVHTVDTLGTHADERDIDVLLAMALAVRAPSRGHICVSLAAVSPADLLPEDADLALADTLALPADRAAWIDRVRASSLVGPLRPLQLDGDWLYTTRYYAYEQSLAAGLRTRFTERRAPADAALLRTGLASLFSPRGGVDRQQLGAAMAALRGLTVISGGPGTGKTHTVSRVLTLLWAQWAACGGAGLGPRVALAAPTGKAAARMKESIQGGLADLLAHAAPALPDGRTPQHLHDFLTALQPATLHRLLGYQPQNPTRFRHNHSDPLPFDIVIVDEASMVDFAMMAKLVDATDPAARLVLLGDKNQLASVEAGTVLADIAGPLTPEVVTLSASFTDDLASLGIDTQADRTAAAPGPQDGITLLTDSRRFNDDSGIGRFAKACLSHPEDALAALDDPNTALLPHGANGQLAEPVLEQILHRYSPYLDLLLAGPKPGEARAQHHAAVIHAFDTFRVLAAHRRGRLGVDGLNDAIARALAHRHQGFDPTTRHYFGRPVLVRTNAPVVGRYNGDVGLLVTDEHDHLVAAFAGEAGVEYLAVARLPDHQTVFAMTIHKSQGSEFDNVLVVLPDADSPILTRELVYTAATRAKQTMGLVSTPDVLHNALSRTVKRASGLQQKLWATQDSP